MWGDQYILLNTHTMNTNDNDSDDDMNSVGITNYCNDRGHESSGFQEHEVCAQPMQVQMQESSVHSSTTETMRSGGSLQRKQGSDGFHTFSNQQPVQKSIVNGKHPIPTNLNIEDWVGQGKRIRYVIPRLIEPKNGKIEEKIGLDHASDKVVWNLLYMFDNDDTIYPSGSPKPQEKMAAVDFLVRMRSQFIKVFVEEAKTNYFRSTFKDEWAELTRENGGRSFSSYADLEYKTKQFKEELVRNG